MVKRGAGVGLGVGVAALFALASCVGLIEDPAPGGPGGPGGPGTRPDGSFICDPDGLPSITPLRRLSQRQYENTLRDLFASTGIDPAVDAAAELARIPIDDVGLPFRGMDSSLADAHARAYFRIADRLATVTTTRVAEVAGDCAIAPAPDAACVDAFLDDFGMRAYRRPLSAEERARYQALNDGTRDGTELVRSLVFSLLLAPQFLYQVELDGEGTDQLYALGAYELASRLSYHFWQTMPDDALFASAADGSILTEAGYAAEVDRLMGDPRTETTAQHFYDEWFRLGWLTSFPTTPAFATLAEGTTIGEGGADHLAAMTDEIHALTRHFTFEAPGTFRDMLLTDLSFTSSPHLASLYGVAPWDGTGEQPHLPASERSGLLTRAAFLVTGTIDTSPIHRGAVVRRRILCDDLPQPDPTALPDGALTPPPVTADQTTRERYEEKTRNEPCASCHVRMNPIGFVLEGYDALGRFRTEERIIDEVSGEELAVLPIDTSSSPQIAPDSTAVISTGAELSQEVADSGKTEGCFARQYFRFTFGRDETSEDGCALERVRAVLAGDGSLRDALRVIALDPGFRSRRVL